MNIEGTVLEKSTVQSKTADQKELKIRIDFYRSSLSYTHFLNLEF